MRGASERDRPVGAHPPRADRPDVSRQAVNGFGTGRYDLGLPLAFKIVEVFEQPIEPPFFPTDEEGQP